MKYRKIFIAVLLMIVFNVDVVQASLIDKSMTFNRLRIEDGLSQVTVQNIFQDSEGYMWFATEDGLNKYDGKKFEIYKSGLNKERALSYNWITCMNEDLEGNLWVGTLEGLNKIDKKTEEITIYLEENGELSNSNIRNIFVNNEGELYISTKGGLNVYNEKTDTFERILYEGNKTRLTSDIVFEVLQDSKGVYWISTDKGLNSYNEKTDEVVKYTVNSKEEKNKISGNYIQDIHIDQKERLWIATSGGGINVLDLNTGDIEVYKNECSDKNSIPSDFVRTVMSDSNGDVWIGTDEGLALFREETTNFSIYKSKIYDTTTLTDNKILSLFQDSSGLIWAGTPKGVNYFNPNSIFTNYKQDPFDDTTMNNSMIFAVYQDKDELLWLGTNGGGVNILDRKENVTYKLNETLEKDLFLSETITDITGIDNEIWIATSQEVVYINKDTKETKTFFSGKNEEVRTIFIDKDKLVWIGTERSLYTIDEEFKLKDYSQVFKSNKIQNPYVSTIYEDNLGTMWIGLGAGGGLIRYDEENNTMDKYSSIKGDETTLTYSSIKDIKEDLEGNLWVSTNSGLNRYNKETDDFTRFTELNGLSNNFVYSILVDKGNNLWLSTNKGISRYNQISNEFINFYVEDGLQGNEFNNNASFKNKDGEMFFGGINGLNSFHPDEFKENETNRTLVIDNVMVAGEQRDVSDNIILDYFEKKLEITVFLADYRYANKTVYAYKLEGLDEEWLLEGDKRTITYTNLEPGEYNLLISAQNSYGKWSELTQLTITKKREPWKTGFAYFIYLVIAGIITYFIINRVKLLNSLIKQRTEELNQQLIENDILYRKTLEIEVNKNNYFVNLSHELRTPLNVILSTESLLSKLNENEEHIAKDKLNYYMGILKRNSTKLLKLINNIIDTSKIEAGAYNLDIKKHDIIYEIEEMALSMKDYIESKGIEFIIDPLVEEKIIECDINDIEKCITNLLSNATKFTPEGGKIEVIIEEIEETEIKEERIKISVKDTGKGIAPEDLRKIFDRFGQSNNRENIAIQGSGIGLFLTKQIVELHNGELSVESEVGKGSTFIIILPVKYTSK